MLEAIPDIISIVDQARKAKVWSGLNTNPPEDIPSATTPGTFSMGPEEPPVDNSEGITLNYKTQLARTDNPYIHKQLTQQYSDEMRKRGILVVQEQGPIETATRPLVENQFHRTSTEEVEKATGLPHPVAATAGVLQRFGVGMAEGLTSPAGLVTLGGTAIPKALHQAISALFAGQMAAQAPSQAAELGTALGEGDYEKAGEAGLGLGGSLVFGREATKSALGMHPDIIPIEDTHATKENLQPTGDIQTPTPEGGTPTLNSETPSTPVVRPPAPAEFHGSVTSPSGRVLETWNLTDDIEGHPKGSTVSRGTLESQGYEVPEAPKTVESVEAPKESGSIIEQNQPERPMFHNEAGYLLRSKELGFKAETKVDGQQLGNRLKNKLTPGEYMALQEQGLGEFLKEKRSPEEVAKWVEENGPKVETKELYANAEEVSKARQEEAQAIHELETAGWHTEQGDWYSPEGRRYRFEDDQILDVAGHPTQATDFPPALLRLQRAYAEDIGVRSGANESATARFITVNPKPLDKMPGAVDLLVRVPLGRDKSVTTEHLPEGKTKEPKYTSSHYPTEGKNLLAHVRGYMETTPDGKKVFHVFEVQSDWAQEMQSYKNKLKENSYEDTPERRNMRGVIDDPLLKHYERLALKAAIDHARKNGADAVALSDAQTAMLTEEHDKVENPIKTFKTPEEAKLAAGELKKAGFKGEIDVGGNFDNKTVEAWWKDQADLDLAASKGFGPYQAGGMRLHYDQTLPKIMEELTGEKGKVVDFGEHKNAVQEQRLKPGIYNVKDLPLPETTKEQLLKISPEAKIEVETDNNTRLLNGDNTRFSNEQFLGLHFDYQGIRNLETYLPHENPLREDLIFKNPDGTPKTTITARQYPLSKARKSFSLFGSDKPIKESARQTPPKGINIQLGGNEAGFVGGGWVEHLDNLHRGAITSVRSAKTIDEVAGKYDAIDNQARIVGKRYGNSIRLRVGEKADREELTAIVESGVDLAKLRADSNLVQGSKATDEVKEIYRDAVTHFDRLKGFAQRVSDIHENELKQEKARGILKNGVEDYVAHRYDDDILFGRKAPVVLSASGGGKNSAFFKKQRTFDTYAEALAAGYKPRTLDVADLVEHRITAGQRLINQQVFVEGLKTTKSPLDNEPLVRDANSRGGAPRGYRIMEPFPGQRVAVHEAFYPLVRALTGESHVPAVLSKTAGLIKHGMLMFDTFHASRVFQKALFLDKEIGYKKGLALLEYNTKDLAKAVSNGEITQEAADWAKTNGPVVQQGIKNGLNVGKISDALYKDATAHIPLVGEHINSFNKFVFDKLTRGVMTEGYLAGLERNKKLYPKLNGDQVARKTAMEINTYFGNLQSQGVFKSRTWRDMSRLAFLAPQWVESMARTEVGAATQLAKGKPGNLTAGVGKGLLAYMAATQVINMFTTGHPTWENEDSKHKLDAYIPDWIQGGPGFYMSPLSVVAEMSHDAIRYAEAGKGFLGTAAQIAKNKMSPVARAEEDLRTGEDFFGKPLPTSMDRIKQAAIDLAPLPLPTKAFQKSYLGSTQRQLASSAGFKIEPKKVTVEEVASKMFGEGTKVETLPTYQRRQLSKQLSKDRPPETDEERLMITKRAAETDYETRKNLEEGLSKENKEFIASHKLQLPGFETREMVKGQSIGYTDKEKEFIAKAMVKEYNVSLDRLRQQPGWDALTQEQKQHRLELLINGKSGFFGAKDRARRELQKARRSGSIIEQN